MDINAQRDHVVEATYLVVASIFMAAIIVGSMICADGGPVTCYPLARSLNAYRVKISRHTRSWYA
jgi:hypothetical protein